MRKALFVLFLFVGPVFAQDVPKIRPLNQSDLVSEIGSLHLQVKQLTEYVETLRATITQLQEENAKLKAK